MSGIPSLSLSASNASFIPSSSLSIPKQVNVRFPSKVELTVPLSWCLKVIWSILLATSLYGEVPLGVGLYLKRISDAEKLLIPVSKISSKSVSINRILSGSITVIFFVLGPTLNIKVSPVIVVWVLVGFWIIFILDALSKPRVYTSSVTPEPALIVDVKLLLGSPVMFELLVVAEINEASEEPSWKVRTGELGALKSILVSPLDSSQFRIPSLSKSISILSMILSLSKSSGQTLTGIIWESKVLPEQSSVPLSM